MNLSCMPHKWHRLLDFNLIHLQTSVKDRNIEIQRNTDVRNDLTELNTLYRSHRAWDSLFLHAVNKLTLFWAPPLLLKVACSENLNRTSHRNELEISVHVFFFLAKCAHKVVKLNWNNYSVGWNWVWNYKSSFICHFVKLHSNEIKHFKESRRMLITVNWKDRGLIWKLLQLTASDKRTELLLTFLQHTHYDNVNTGCRLHWKNKSNFPFFIRFQ